jgi:hypothetical protein
MLNVGIILLLTIFIAIVIAGGAGILIVILSPSGDGTVQFPLCSQGMLSDLQDVSNQPCVVGPLGVTNKRYTENYTQQSILVPYPVSYKLSCATICNSIDANSNCIGTVQQQNTYSSCIDTLKPPPNCGDIALPAARVQATPYYLETYYGTVGSNDPPPLKPPTVKQCIF